jgi:hypothetical protein
MRHLQVSWEITATQCEPVETTSRHDSYLSQDRKFGETSHLSRIECRKVIASLFREVKDVR